MSLEDAFNYLEKTKRIELFDCFGIQRPNKHLRYEFIEDRCGYTQAEIKIYFSPVDFCKSSLADLLCNQSFCRAWWGEEGLGWWANSHIAFQILRDSGLKDCFIYMWKTKCEKLTTK